MYLQFERCNCGGYHGYVAVFEGNKEVRPKIYIPLTSISQAFQYLDDGLIGLTVGDSSVQSVKDAISIVIAEILMSLSARKSLQSA